MTAARGREAFDRLEVAGVVRRGRASSWIGGASRPPSHRRSSSDCVGDALHSAASMPRRPLRVAAGRCRGWSRSPSDVDEDPGSHRYCLAAFDVEHSFATVRRVDLTSAQHGTVSNLLHAPGPLAQLVEHRTFNPLVQGSSPWRPTVSSPPARISYNLRPRRISDAPDNRRLAGKNRPGYGGLNITGIERFGPGGCFVQCVGGATPLQPAGSRRPFRRNNESTWFSRMTRVAA